MKRFLWLAGLVLFALLMGLWLGSAREQRPQNAERVLLDLKFARTMLPLKVTFTALLGGVFLTTLGGLGWGVVRWMHRRADTLYPDRAGLYPLRIERVGRSRVFHDPNRTVVGTTVYAMGEQSLSVQHVLPGGQEAFQSQVTGQAQAAQALRAAVSGSAPLSSARGFPAQLFDRTVSRPLPEVKELAWEPSHIERLLLRDGDPESDCIL